MKKSWYFIYTISILSAIFLAGSPVSALEYSVSGDLSYLTGDSSLRWNPEISGENVVWVEKFGYGQAVYLYNIPAGKKSLLTFSRYSDYDPAISENMIVWSEKSNYNAPSQIIIYNISSGKYFFVDSYPANQGIADVSGDYVAWLDGRYYGFPNIFLKNTATGKEVLFRESRTGDKKSLTISGDYLYWVEKGTLYKRSLSGGDLIEVAKDVSDYFSVSGDLVAWEEMSGGCYSVVVFDGKKDEKTTISGQGWNIRNPSVSGDVVVYENHENAESDIFLYDSFSGVMAAVYCGVGDQIDPKISGERIVWVDKQNGDSNIAYFKADKIAKPCASFSATETDSRDGLPPLVVHFTGKTMIAPGSMTSYVWDFGDGELSSEGSPVHTYLLPGQYSVSLTVSNDFGTDVVRKENYITVGKLPAVDFTSEGIMGVAPYTTRFHEISTGDIDDRIWDFGDGIGSVLRNPHHIFRYAGLYTVSLTVRNKYGGVIETKEDLIEVGGAPNAAFVYSYDEQGTDVRPVVCFSDISSGNPDSWLWYFGDGTFSTEKNPVHTFNNAGIYDVSLKVTNRYAEDIKTEKDIVLAKISEYSLEEIIIVPNEAGLISGEMIQYVAAARDTAGNSRIIIPKWSVANNTVAEMDLLGVLTAKETGKTKVVCSYMNMTAISYVEVGSKRYARSGELPALVLTDSLDDISEDTRKLVKIFYLGSE